MRFATVVRHAMEKYPTLFQHREQVLDQVLCTIGNGYAWMPDGSIASDTPGEKHVKRTLRQVVEERDHPLYKLGYKLGANKGETLDQYLARRIEEDIATYKNAAKPRYYYPLCPTGGRYALVQNVPDNVRQDCLDACFEVLQLVIDSKGHGVPTFGKGVHGDDLMAKLQAKARQGATEHAKAMRKMDVDSIHEAENVLKEIEARFPERKALKDCVTKVAVPHRCDPSFYITKQSLLEYGIDDVLELKFDTGRRVAKKYKGKKVRFVVNNYLDYSWGRDMRRLALVPVGGTTRDTLILEEWPRFEGLMEDLFPCNRRPYAGWKSKRATVRKV